MTPVTQLHTTSVTPTSISLAWDAPAHETEPVRYGVLLAVVGATRWKFATFTGLTRATIRATPGTHYYVAILAYN